MQANRNWTWLFFFLYVAIGFLVVQNVFIGIVIHFFYEECDDTVHRACLLKSWNVLAGPNVHRDAGPVEAQRAVDCYNCPG